MELGSMIQFYRTKNGLTQKELANGVCSVSYLSKIESGAIEPKPDTVELLFERLKMDYEKLTSYDVPTIHNQINQLYKHISNKQLDQAKSIVNELKEIITPFHDPDLQKYFQLIHFYYLIVQDTTNKLSMNLQELMNLEDTFKGEKLFYFYKIVGFYYNCHLNSKMANQYFHKAIEILEEQNLRDPEIYYLLALSYMGMQKPVYSNYYVGMALEQYANDLLYRKVTDCYHLLGINYLNLGAFDISETYLQQVLQSKPMGDSPTVHSRVTHNLGIMHERRGDLDQALKFLHDALEHHENLYDVAHSTIMIAKIYFQKGEHHLAEEYIKQGESKLQGSNLTKIRHRFYILKHQLYNKTHDQAFIDRAENVILPYYKSVGETALTQELLELLAEVYTEKQEYEKAIEYYKRLTNINN
ncbi:transcriptional regulator [Filobacillus milosensis]|uniref:Transcriptional regulator n=1 Tax=Filobacillus milosensis TaxID=94137 RepID=A0A4Y8IKR8_9BACI|nr:transcriptional regulator [Filobacillus milosensis]TFB21720.1 transcriptional regulator [Filobacillus milosensis]